MIRVFNDIPSTCVGDLYRLTRALRAFHDTLRAHPHHAATARLIIMLLYEKVIHVNGEKAPRKENAKEKKWN